MMPELLSLLGSLVLHALWLIVPCTAPMFLLRRYRGDSDPRLQYGLSMLSLAAMLISTVALVVSSLPAETEFPEGVVTAPSGSYFEQSFAAVSVTDFENTATMSPPLQEIRPTAAIAMPQHKSLSETSHWKLPTTQDTALAVIAIVYVVGFLLMMIRLGLAMLGTWQLRRCSEKASPEFKSMLKEQGQKLNLRRYPALRICSSIGIPVVIGTLRPILVLPTAMVEALSYAELRSVLLHELAHLKRFDHYLIWLQRVTETILFFHPGTWYVSRIADLTREQCCDDQVIRSGVSPQTYVHALFLAAQLRMDRESPPLSLALSNSKNSVLHDRIRRLLNPHSPRVPKSPLRLSLTAALVLVTLPGLGMAYLITASPDLDRRPLPEDSAAAGKEPSLPSSQQTLETSDQQRAESHQEMLVQPNPSALNSFPEDLQQASSRHRVTSEQLARLRGAVTQKLEQTKAVFHKWSQDFVLLADQSVTSQRPQKTHQKSSTAPDNDETPAKSAATRPASKAPVSQKSSATAPVKVTTHAEAEQTVLNGTVVDHEGKPISNVTVILALHHVTEHRDQMKYFIRHNALPSQWSGAPDELGTSVTTEKGRFHIRTKTPIHLGSILWAFSPDHGLAAHPVIYRQNDGLSDPPTAETQHRIQFSEPNPDTPLFQYQREEIDGRPFPEKPASRLTVQPAIVHTRGLRRIQHIPFFRFFSRAGMGDAVHVPRSIAERMTFVTDDQGQIPAIRSGPFYSWRVTSESGLTQLVSRNGFNDKGYIVRREGTIRVSLDQGALLPEGSEIVTSDGHLTTTCQPQPDGTYLIPSLYGSRSFKVRTPGNRPFQLKPFRVHVVIGEQTNIRSTVIPPANVRGRVRLETGASVANAVIQVSVRDRSSHRTTTNSEGEFEIEAPPGKLSGFSIVKLPEELADDYYGIDLQGTLQFREGNPVLKSGQTYQHPVMTLPQRTTLTATIVDPNGQPVPKAYVSVHSRYGGKATTSDDGVFTIPVSHHWIDRTSVRHHHRFRTHLFVSTKDRWIPAEVVSRSPWVFRHIETEPVSGDYSNGARRRLEQTAMPKHFERVPLERALEDVIGHSHVAVNDDDLKAMGLKSSQLLVSGDYPGMPAHLMAERILAKWNLKIIEREDPRGGGMSSFQGLLEVKPEFAIVPR